MRACDATEMHTCRLLLHEIITCDVFLQAAKPKHSVSEKENNPVKIRDEMIRYSRMFLSKLSVKTLEGFIYQLILFRCEHFCCLTLTSCHAGPASWPFCLLWFQTQIWTSRQELQIFKRNTMNTGDSLCNTHTRVVFTCVMGFFIVKIFK